MNVIFLDFDGVIDTSYYRSDEQMEGKIKILSDICHEYDCKVVIEASAKDAMDEGTLEIDDRAVWLLKIFEWFDKYDIECIGRTPNVCRKMWKEDEIRLFLFRHPEIEHYCIIDDDDLTFLHRKSDLDKVRDHLVETKYYVKDDPEEEGLQPYHREEVGKVLKLENDMRKYALKRNKKSDNTHE